MNYYKILLPKNMVKKSLDEGFIGVGFRVLEDLSPYLKKDYDIFIEKFQDAYFKIMNHTRMSKILAKRMWIFAKEIKKGDKILFSQGDLFYIGEVAGDYYYDTDAEDIKHRRKINWIGVIEKVSTNKNFQKWVSSGQVRNTIRPIEDCHYNELENLISSKMQPIPYRGLEEELEKNMIDNWECLSLSNNYFIKEVQLDIGFFGRIDILAKHKTKNEYLVIELKKGGSTDKVLGQTLRYMGWVKANYKSDVKGLIISHSHELLKTAASIVNDPHKIVEIKSPSEIINEYSKKIKQAA